MFARAISASLLALIAAHAIGPAAAESAPLASKELCAAYLKDLDVYRQLAIAQGCKIPGDEAAATTVPAPQQVAAVEADVTDFPPVVDDVPAAPAQDFPPVVDETSGQPEAELPPVETSKTETETAPAPVELPPVVSEAEPKPSNPDFPPVESSSGGMGEVGMQEQIDPASEVRQAIKEKLLILKEEAKQRVKDAIILKAEEVKERVKQKIKDKIEAAIEGDNGDDAQVPTLRRAAKDTFKQKIKDKLEATIERRNGGDAQPTLRRSAKDAIKRAIVERHSGSGLMNKLSQLRRR